MKIALAQLNPTVGALQANADNISQAANQAAISGARLMIAPELAICGYPPKDQLLQHGYAQECLRQLQMIADATKDSGVAVLLGSPEQRFEAAGVNLYNSAFLIDKGSLRSVCRKQLLPVYDVFDEARWFAPADSPPQVLEFEGVRLGVHICEDGWNAPGFWEVQRYEVDPVASLVEQGCDLLVNLSASPWCQNRDEMRREMFAHSCKTHGIPGILVNQVGANDDLIFDGSSLALGADGKTSMRMPSFEESVESVEFRDGTLHSRNALESMSSKESALSMLADALESGVRDYVTKCGFRKVLIGSSGGIDSALVAVIASRALGPDKVHTIGMPSEYSSQGSIDDARQLAENLGISFDLISIEKPYAAFLESLRPSFQGTEFGVAEENLQARTRGMILMAHSNKFGALVLATGNKSELATGYSTLYGDMCGALEVIGDLFKTEVYQLARHYVDECGVQIPHAILTKAPSAELRPDQKDSDTLPEYDVLDNILQRYLMDCQSVEKIVESGLDEKLVRQVLKMVDQAEYKRQQAPPMLRVSRRAFGAGRSLPIAQRLLH